MVPDARGRVIGVERKALSYSDEDILRQLDLGEDSHWEFKRIESAGTCPSRPRRDDLADEIAAFANARGGVLLCGVADDGEVQDLSREQLVALDSLLVNLSSDALTPPVHIHTEHRQLPDGKRLLLVDVPRSESQHDSPGGSYVRVGGAKRRMTGDERLRLAQRRGQARALAFDERTVSTTGLNTLEESLWKPLLSAEGAMSPESALAKLALLGDDESGTTRATVAGVLVCTPHPEQWFPNACITATCYRGRDRASGQVDAQEIVGPVNRQIADAMGFAVRNMRASARKDPARTELPQYSDRALFEALVNAVAHRDYAIRASRIRLSMFEDRVEIQSPGALPNSLTLASIGTRQATRNEALTSLFGRMPVGGVRGSEDRLYFMERRGDGVPIIRRETLAICGRLPEYQLIDDAEVLLTIPAAVQEESPANVVVTVRSAGNLLAGADILALFPNRTWKLAQTGEGGEAILDLHTTHLPITVFVSALGYAAHLERDWIPSRRALTADLRILPGGGSVIFPEAAGYIPGLKGRLNPIRDAHDRTYLYASNIAINDGAPQPVHFAPGEVLRMSDADGFDVLARIVDVVGRSALVEYRPDDQSGLPW